MQEIEARCRELLNNEQYQEVAHLLEEVVTSTPTVLTLRGRALSGMNRWPEAQQAFQAALEQDRECHEALAGLGLLSLLAGDRKQALALIHEAARLAPNEGRYRGLRGVLYAQDGDVVTALQDFESAKALGDRDPAMALSRAQIHIAQGKSSLAREALDEALSWGAEQASLLQLEAALLRIQEEPQKALETYRKAVEHDPSQVHLWWELVGLTSLLERERLDEVLTQALEHHPDDERMLVLVVGRLREAGLAERALEVLRKAVDRQPDAVSLWAVLGDYLRELDRFDESLECFEKALEVDPYFARAHFGKGLAIGNREEAVNSFATAAQLAPDNVVFCYHFGAVLCALEKYDSAIKVLDRAISLDETFWRAYLERAICYENTDRFQRARQDRETAETLRKQQRKS